MSELDLKYMFVVRECGVICVWISHDAKKKEEKLILH